MPTAKADARKCRAAVLTKLAAFIEAFGQGRARRIGDPGLLPRLLLPLRVDCIESVLEACCREDQNVGALRLCRTPSRESGNDVGEPAKVTPPWIGQALLPTAAGSTLELGKILETGAMIWRSVRVMCSKGKIVNVTKGAATARRPKQSRRDH